MKITHITVIHQDPKGLIVRHPYNFGHIMYYDNGLDTHLGGGWRLSMSRVRQAGEVWTRYTAHHSMHPTIAWNFTTCEGQLSLALCQGVLGS